MGIVVRPVERTTVERLVHWSNTLSPIDVTLFGIAMLVRLVHKLNAYLPMLVKPLGSSTLVRFLQSLNIFSVMGVEEPRKTWECSVLSGRMAGGKVKTTSLFVKTKALFIKTKALLVKTKALFYVF